MALIPLIYTANDTAYYGFASSGAVVYILGYCGPLAVRIIWGMEQSNLKKGPFTLGRYSRPLAIVSLVLCVFLVIFMCLPTMLPATAVNANYAPAVLTFGTVFLPTVGWFAYGRKTYIGVAQRVTAENVLSEEDQGHYIVEPKKSEPKKSD
ncbi:amino acid/polyamine transporter I [Penicillium sp. IBT 31633x]|nr:amino acid/polyamine transporter I [Penicillium sp. IBT 31633x]